MLSVRTFRGHGVSEFGGLRPDHYPDGNILHIEMPYSSSQTWRSIKCRVRCATWWTYQTAEERLITVTTIGWITFMDSEDLVAVVARNAMPKDKLNMKKYPWRINSPWNICPARLEPVCLRGKLSAGVPIMFLACRQHP